MWHSDRYYTTSWFSWLVYGKCFLILMTFVSDFFFNTQHAMNSMEKWLKKAEVKKRVLYLERLSKCYSKIIRDKTHGQKFRYHFRKDLISAINNRSWIVTAPPHKNMLAFYFYIIFKPKFHEKTCIFTPLTAVINGGNTVPSF